MPLADSLTQHRGVGSRVRLTYSALEQAHALIQSQHQIHVLNRHAAGAFNQVVDGGEDHQLVAVEANRDVAEVGEGDVFRCRDMIDDSDKRLTSVEAAIDFEQLSLCLLSLQTRVDGTEDASIHGH